MLRWECLSGHKAAGDREVSECFVCLASMMLMEES